MAYWPLSVSPFPAVPAPYLLWAHEHTLPAPLLRPSSPSPFTPFRILSVTSPTPLTLYINKLAFHWHHWTFSFYQPLQCFSTLSVLVFCGTTIHQRHTWFLFFKKERTEDGLFLRHMQEAYTFQEAAHGKKGWYLCVCGFLLLQAAKC